MPPWRWPDIHRVVGPAVERDLRIECSHLGHKPGDLSTRYIGGISHQEVNGSVERCSIVAGHECRSRTLRSGIVTGALDRRGTDVSADPGRFPQLCKQRQDEGTRAGPEIANTQAARAMPALAYRLQCGLDDGFRFRTRHESVSID